MKSKKGPVSDFDLKKCLKGNKKEWDAFVEAYSNIVYSAILHTLRRYGIPGGENAVQEISGDIFQEIFIRLIKDNYRLLKRYDQKKSSLSTYLTLIARSTSVDFLRRQKGSMHTSLKEDLASDEREREAVGRKEYANLNIPYDILSTRQKAVLKLMFDDNKSVEEIAHILNITPHSVHSMKNKAINKLKRYFKTHEK
ncbi:RNA polymerase sigma factor [Spirochaetota bacterium]